MRYYKQRFGLSRTVAVAKNQKAVGRVLQQYRALGWTGSTGMSGRTAMEQPTNSFYSKGLAWSRFYLCVFVKRNLLALWLPLPLDMFMAVSPKLCDLKSLYSCHSNFLKLYTPLTFSEDNSSQKEYLVIIKVWNCPGGYTEELNSNLGANSLSCGVKHDLSDKLVSSWMMSTSNLIHSHLRFPHL